MIRTKLYRNAPVRRELAVSVLVTGAFFVVGLMWPAGTPLLLLLLGLSLTGVHVAYLQRRYADLEQLAARADRVLHGQDDVLLTDTDEGEIALVSSEICKMTVRLREQAAALQREKQFLTDLLADIFHQLRTPLTSMRLDVSLLRAQDLSSARRIALCRAITRQLERTQWLVESLLKLSKIDAGTAVFHMRTVSIAEIVERAVQPLRIPLELREQTLRVCVDGVSFTGDPDWSTELLANLLKNCLEHTPVGGTIEVLAEETALYTRLVVQDDGPGLDAADIPHLFERFYKGKNAAPDSIGIGLAFCQSVARAQNGIITGSNRPEGGACFTVKFYKSVI